MKKEVVYLAGPYRSPEGPWGIHENIQRARQIAIELWRMGYAVICPHCNTAFFDGACHDDVWLEGDIAILRKCDIVVMMPRYLESEGARAEFIAAEAAGIPVFMWPSDKGVLERRAKGCIGCPA